MSIAPLKSRIHGQEVTLSQARKAKGPYAKIVAAFISNTGCHLSASDVEVLTQDDAVGHVAIHHIFGED